MLTAAPLRLPVFGWRLRSATLRTNHGGCIVDCNQHQGALSDGHYGRLVPLGCDRDATERQA